MAPYEDARSEPFTPVAVRSENAQGAGGSGLLRLFEHRRCGLSGPREHRGFASSVAERAEDTDSRAGVLLGDFLSLERKLLRRRAHTPAPALSNRKQSKKTTGKR